MKVVCLPPVRIMAASANHIAIQEDDNKLEKWVNLEYILEHACSILLVFLFMVMAIVISASCI